MSTSSTTSTTLSEKKWLFFYETKMWTLSEQRWAIMIIGLLHIPIGLSLRNIAYTQGRFHLFLFVFYSISSMSYNIALMLFGHRLYIHANTWKKLTYIFGISLWDISIIYLMDLKKYPTLRASLEYLQFATILIIQENKPQSYNWNWYPIYIHIILFIIVQIYSIIILQKYPNYNYKNLTISCIFFLFAYLTLCMIKEPFTYNSKKETDDYLRIYHSMCDSFISIAFYWFWKILPSTDHADEVKRQ